MLILLGSQGFAANKWYVNDGFTAGDVYCSAIGNNANPGTAAAPFLTVTHVISNKVLAAGDTVFIDAGTYSDNLMMNTNADGGSALSQLVFKGAGSSLSKFVYTGGANAVYFGNSGAGNSYTSFIDLYFETTANVSTIYVEQGSNSNIVFNSCSFKSNVTGGAMVLKGCNNSQVRSCSFNTIYDGIDVYSCSNSVFDGNTFVHNGAYVPGGNHLAIIITGTALFGGPAIADNNVISSNKISGFNYGFNIQQEGVGNTWVNNYVWDCEIGMFCWNGGAGTHENNTFKYNSIVSDKSCIEGACLNWDISNNILYTKSALNTNYCINIANAGNDPSTLNYNIYYSPNGAQTGFTATTGLSYNTLANWQAATGKDASSYENDPGFTSLVNLDLAAGAFAIDKGQNDLTVTDDVRRNPAIVRVAPKDIGAFEYFSPCVAADTALAATIPNICNSVASFDLDTYIGTSKPGSWTIQGGPGGYLASIAGDGHTFTVNNTAAGTYTVRHTLAAPTVGCPSYSERTFVVYAASVGGSVTADATVCSGSNGATLNLSGHTGSVVKWQYSTDGGGLWNDIVNATTAQPYSNIVTTTQYRAVVQSGTCAAANSTAAIITVDPVSVGGAVTADATVCAGTNGATLNLAGHTGSVVKWQYSTDGGGLWNDIVNATTSQAYSNIVTTTQYRAVVQSGVCPAANSSAATVTIDPITVSINDKSVCEGSSTFFDAGAGYTTYSWSGLGTGNAQTTAATIAGVYTITVTDGFNCSATDNATLTVNAFPMPDLGEDTSMCEGQNIVLDPHTNNTLNYAWSNTASTPTISVNSAGQYIVSVSDNIGCSGKDTVFVQVHDLPFVSLGNDLTICDNNYDKVTLHASYSGTKQLLWSTAATNVDSIIVPEAGSYWVQVTDSNQCSTSDNIELTVFCEDYELEWPNVITPNGDGFNDIFKPKGVDDNNFQKVIANVRIISFGVYDRWGRFMFYSEENVLPNWDGKFNGSPAASGTYFYVIRYKNSAGKEYEVSGYLTLME
ncbi:MAG: gliding motility-associated C-terminal domain-containing protein [Flavobacteriales bacterium]